MARFPRRGAAVRRGAPVRRRARWPAGRARCAYDAAIVTDIPGTTRDPLREQLLLDDLPVTIVDTAGLRESADPIEREGVRRTRVEVTRADRVLWVADARTALATSLRDARAAIG